MLKVPAEHVRGGEVVSLQDDPAGHGEQESAPEVAYIPSGHGIGTLVAFDGQKWPGGHNEQKEAFPVE
jgi:hypothetical protein